MEKLIINQMLHIRLCVTCLARWSCAGRKPCRWRRKCLEPRSWPRMPSWEPAPAARSCCSYKQEDNFWCRILQGGRRLPEPLVHPCLPEVAIQGVDFVHLIHRAHRPDNRQIYRSLSKRGIVQGKAGDVKLSRWTTAINYWNNQNQYLESNNLLTIDTNN